MTRTNLVNPVALYQDVLDSVRADPAIKPLGPNEDDVGVPSPQKSSYGACETTSIAEWH
jgi:hypothetical protein